MYKFYNANILGKFEDDCTVRAISCATNQSWDCVYHYLSDLAQEKGTMMDNRQFIINYLDNNFERLNVDNELVGELSYKYRDNVILITMPGHIVCSKYGTIYDTFDCRDRVAEYCWLVK